MLIAYACLEWSDINSHEAVALFLVGIWPGLMLK
jgi:hypothetical protein